MLYPSKRTQNMKTSHAVRQSLFKQPISPLSLSAHERLSSNGMADVIERLVEHFTLLIDVEHSKLSSLKSSAHIDNREFLNDLTKNADKIIKSIQSNKPYHFLFSDVIHLQDQLQIVLGYYQTQINRKSDDEAVLKEDSDSSRFIRNAQKQGSKTFQFFQSLNAKPGRLLNDDESELAAKYVINYCAASIMQKDVHDISDFVTRPLISDEAYEQLQRTLQKH